MQRATAVPQPADVKGSSGGKDSVPSQPASPALTETAGSWAGSERSSSDADLESLEEDLAESPPSPPAMVVARGLARRRGRG